MFENCPKCGEKIEGNPKFCPECGNPLSKNKEKIKSPGKKVWIISGIAIVVITIIFASLYVYSSGMIQSNNYTNTVGNNNSQTANNSNVSQETKTWVQRVGIGYGPWIEGIDAIETCTRPYYINTELVRINWSFNGGVDCHFNLQIWTVGNLGPSNETDTISAIESLGALYIDDGPGYYYFQMTYNDLYSYMIKIFEWK